MQRAWRNNSGNITIFAAGVAAALAMVFALLVGSGRILLVHASAQVAADLAAVAAAYSQWYGEPGCEIAALTAQRNGAELLECQLLPAGAVQVRTAVAGHFHLPATAVAAPL